MRSSLKRIRLVSAAEKHPNVTLYFHHKLTSCDFKTGEMVFEKQVIHIASFILNVVRLVEYRSKVLYYFLIFPSRYGIIPTLKYLTFVDTAFASWV